ncbi:unnamed protein product [Darwinula stevensoni]|uniref:DUF4817 domain-containing protein n=1 Tax=Darwinula stevensoni TaxID=69355 RepID=A0A7R9A6S7_9CRUS|nr:unnamed protein product [Darwinula stevensoni]CAG0895574.1 unnamed protein product [Darwinula stevensoni]
MVDPEERYLVLLFYSGSRRPFKIFSFILNPLAPYIHADPDFNNEDSCDEIPMNFTELVHGGQRTVAELNTPIGKCLLLYKDPHVGREFQFEYIRSQRTVLQAGVGNGHSVTMLLDWKEVIASQSTITGGFAAFLVPDYDFDTPEEVDLTSAECALIPELEVSSKGTVTHPFGKVVGHSLHQRNRGECGRRELLILNPPNTNDFGKRHVFQRTGVGKVLKRVWGGSPDHHRRTRKVAAESRKYEIGVGAGVLAAGPENGPEEEDEKGEEVQGSGHLQTYLNKKSYKPTQEALRKKFNIRVVPAKSAIWKLVNRFRDTGSVLDRPRSGRPVDRMEEIQVPPAFKEKAGGQRKMKYVACRMLRGITITVSAALAFQPVRYSKPQRHL